MLLNSKTALDVIFFIIAKRKKKVRKEKGSESQRKEDLSQERMIRAKEVAMAALYIGRGVEGVYGQLALEIRYYIN